MERADISINKDTGITTVIAPGAVSVTYKGEEIEKVGDGVWIFRGEKMTKKLQDKEKNDE